MAGHYITKCRGCGAVVSQCRCMGPHETRWVESCPACDGTQVQESAWAPSPFVQTGSYDYSRTADTGPASRLKNVEPAVRGAEREIERGKSILHGLVREMEMVAHHTHDQTIQKNFKAVLEFKGRLDAIDKSMDVFLTDLGHFLKGFR